jgi:hypothetical protein
MREPPEERTPSASFSADPGQRAFGTSLAPVNSSRQAAQNA